MIGNLSRRDQLTLAIGGAIALLLLLIFVVILPYRDALHSLDNRISSRQNQLDDLQRMQQEYRQLQRGVGAVERRASSGKNFSLFSFLESTTLSIASRENLSYLRPQPVGQEGELHEESLEVKLEKIRLDQLVKLLYATETADALLRVKTLRTRSRFDDPSLLDVTMLISSYGER